MSNLYTSAISFALVMITTLTVNARNSDCMLSEESVIDFVNMEATVTPKIIHFKWKVNMEQKGNYFIIEKSIDELDWKAVTTVESIKNHRESHIYLTSEINLSQGPNEYFRIKRVDQEEVSTILEVINVSQPILTNLFIIPVSKKINKEIITAWNSMVCSDGVVNVYDDNGTCVSRKKVHFRDGYNRMILNIKKYSNGKYTLILKDEFGNTITKTFTKGEKTGRTKF